MKVTFKTVELQYLYETPLKEIKGKQKYPLNVIAQYKNKVKYLSAVKTLKELLLFKALNFEKLKGNRKGQMSIRLNKQFRLVFVKSLNNNIEVEIIEISKHYE